MHFREIYVKLKKKNLELSYISIYLKCDILGRVLMVYLVNKFCLKNSRKNFTLAHFSYLVLTSFCGYFWREMVIVELSLLSIYWLERNCNCLLFLFQSSPCRRKSFIGACFRTQGEENIYGRPLSITNSPSHKRLQPIDYEDESYFKR